MIDADFLAFRDGKGIVLKLALLAFVCLVFVAYAPSLWSRPYWDDEDLLIAAQRLMALGLNGFSATPELTSFPFYRPIELSLIELDLWLSPTTYAPILFLSLLMHLAKGVITGALIRYAMPANIWAPILGMLIYLAHPMAVSTTIQIDTISANLASLCGALGVFAVLYFSNAGGARLWLALIFISSIAFVGFFAKELFFMIGISLPVLFAIMQYRAGLTRMGGAAVVLGLGVTTAMALYLVVRASHGFVLGAHDQRYHLAFGVNIARNSMTMLAGTLFYSDTNAFLAHRNWLDGIVGVAIFATPLVAVAILAMRYRSAVRLTLQQLNLLELTVIAIAALVGLFPEALTMAVSEHNTAMILPFIVALTVTGFTAVCQCTGQLGLRKPPFALLAAFIVGALAWGLQSVATKTAAARNMSEEVARTYNQVRDTVRVSGAAHVCVNAEMRNSFRRYSIYALSPNDYIGSEVLLLKHQYPRADISWEERSPGHLAGCDLWF